MIWNHGCVARPMQANEEETLARNLAFGGGASGPMGRSVSSIACLAFVVALAIAFWAGVVWIAQALVDIGYFSPV
jgi:hypothetical protein